MSIKVNFEIGHEASIRTKRTPEGFTHDWEVFVRGIDSADISQFVDKVVFQLHETFPKPKRVVKEPPYCVKESGYAGFNLPIEIYLKNRDEPKKIRFNYDLHLQQAGPAIIKTQKEKYVFQNPTDEFRRKLFKGGGMVVNNSAFSLHTPIDHDRNSGDSFVDEKPQQLIGKPKLGGDSSKKHKSKDHRSEDLPRPSNNFVNLFGTPIHKPSRVSPDPKKPSPNPTKAEKKEKEKSHSEKDKQKLKHDSKEKEYKEDKSKQLKDDKEKSKEEKRSKPHKEREPGKEKSSKRPAERPPSPAPPTKRPAPTPPPIPPSPKPNGSVPKEDLKSSKYPESESKNKQSTSKIPENNPTKTEKKVKKDKKSHDKDRESKKEHKKDKEIKPTIPEPKPKEAVKEVPPVKDKDKPVVKPFHKFSLEDFVKDPADSVKYSDGSKHKEKGDRERKHKHKKKDKKRDESREKRESGSKEKKHKTDKHSNKEKILAENNDSPSVSEKADYNTIPREIDKITPIPKLFKEKDRGQLTISPISIDTSSQSSSKSASKTSKSSKNPLGSMIEALSCSSHSESEVSAMSEDEDVSLTSESNSRFAKSTSKTPVETAKTETIKSKPAPETPKVDKPPVEKLDKSVQGSSHKSKNKDKPNKHETKEEKKQRKRKSGSKDDSENNSKSSKLSDEPDHGSKSKRPENSNLLETTSRVKAESSPRVKTDTKVQDDGVSSSLSDHPLKCDSPLSEDASQIDRKQISPDYMIQLKELQHRIMTIQSNDELERVVNLIAETGKYEVTKKTFDFDLCLLDRSTVQQLQELIGCESRA